MAKLAILISILVCAPLAIEAFSRSAARGMLARVVSKADVETPEYLAIGSSRFSAGLDTGVLPPGFFIWKIPMMDLKMMQLILENRGDIVRRTKKMVLLEYSPEIFLVDVLKGRPELVHDLGAVGVRPWEISGFLWDADSWRVSKLFPALGSLQLAPRYWDEPAEVVPANAAPSGFQPMPKIMPEEMRAFWAMGFMKSFRETAPLKPNLERFAWIDAYMKERGIKYCWLQMPLDPNLAELQARLSLKVPAPPEGTRCIAPEKVAAIYGLLKFADTFHLSAESAKVFSEVLKQSL